MDRELYIILSDEKCSHWIGTEFQSYKPCKSSGKKKGKGKGKGKNMLHIDGVDYEVEDKPYPFVVDKCKA